MAFPTELYRPCVPNGKRRAPWHNYYSPSIYLITINAAPGIPPFSLLKGDPDDRRWPAYAELTEIGKMIHTNLYAISRTYPFVSILRRSIMPDHIHFVINIQKKTTTHLGTIISHFKSECTRAFATLLSPYSPSLFESGYHDRLLTKARQLQKMLHYVSDKPRRRLLRIKNRGFFRSFIIIDAKGNQYRGYGNPDLLSDPDIEAVKVSSKFTPEFLRARKICWKSTVENCGVLASPFISEAESRVYNWAIDNGGRIIYIVNNGLPERFAPKGVQHQLCAEGRLLIVAPMQHLMTKPVLTRAVCEAMNSLAVAISHSELRPG